MDPNGREVFTDDDGNLTTDQGDQDVTKLSMPAGVKTAVLAGAESAMGRLEKLQAGLDASKESDSVSDVPPAVAAEFKAIGTSLSGLLSKYPSPKAKDGEGEGDVNKGDDPPHADPSTAGTSSGDDKGDEDGDVNKAGWELPTGAKAKLSAACKAAKALIQGVVDKVKGADEADGDGDPMPPDVAKAIEDAASKLDLDVSKAEDEDEDEDEKKKRRAAKVIDAVNEAVIAADPDIAKSGDEIEERARKLLWKVMRMIDQGALDSDEDKAAAESIFGAIRGAVSKMDESVDKGDAKKASPFTVIKDAANTLDAVMKKLQPGQPIDEDSYQRLERLRALVSSLNTKAPQGEGEGGSDDKDKAAKAGDVAKAGAKMAKKRRQKFQTAIKALIELFKEVMPSSELGKMPHLQVHKSDDELKAARAELKKSQDELAIAKAEVKALKERPAESNVAPVEVTSGGRSKTNKGDDDGSWPFDMNEE
jgi:hypothetical protein